MANIKNLATTAILLSVGIIPRNSMGRQKYVAPNGNDDLTGDINHPWKILSHACSAAQGGDTVFVASGTYREPLRPLNSGTDAWVGGNRLLCHGQT